MSGFETLIKKWILVCSLILLFCPAHAEEITIIGIEGAPYSVINEDHLSGFGTEILKILVQNVGAHVTFKGGVNMKRIFKETHAPNIFIPIFIRTADRENQYHWIGKLTDDNVCFITLKSKPSISSYAEAKNYTVGVYESGAPNDFLREQGLTKIEPSSSRTISLQKLAKGRIDAYFAGKIIAYHSLLRAKLDPKNFTCGKTIKQISYYIAASRKTDESLVKKFKTSFDDLKKSGEYDQLLKKYHINDFTW